MKKAPAKTARNNKTGLFDFAIAPSRRRSRNGEKIGRPRRARGNVAHVRRASVDARHPMHVTLRLARGLPNIRYVEAVQAIEKSIEEANGRFGLRVLEYSIEPDHIHLLIEIDRSQAEYRREGHR